MWKCQAVYDYDSILKENDACDLLETANALHKKGAIIFHLSIHLDNRQPFIVKHIHLIANLFQEFSVMRNADNSAAEAI